LPAYTEWGYNSFGAEFERNYFLASNSIIPCKITYTKGQLQFSLSGVVNGYKEMTLAFNFPTEKYYDYGDLVQLNDLKIDLSTADCTVKMSKDDKDTVLNIVEGELYFKRTQLLFIDDKVNRVILSGTFELRFVENNFPTNISNGRFDLGINENLFYSY
jgi:hypothetical protein